MHRLILMKKLINQLKSRIDNYYNYKKLSKIDTFKKNDFEIFFIISSGRSGSTLLRKELMMNSNVYIPPETDNMIPKIINIWVNQKITYNNKIDALIEFLKKSNFTSLWNINYLKLKIELLELNKSDRNLGKIIYLIYFHQFSQKNNSKNNLIGDKTPFLNYYLRELNIIFPNSKIIYLVRDPRAVISSYIKDRNYPIDKAIKRWKSSIYTYNKYKHIFKDRLLEVKYEDFVLNNERKIDELLSFIKVEKEINSILDLKEKLGDGNVSHYKNIFNPVNNESLEKWKTNLTIEEIKMINSSLSKEMKQFGYE